MASAQVQFTRARETVVHLLGGQTMVEYAMIIGALGIVVWGAYNLMGNSIGSMTNAIDSNLTNA
jgi:Flp pilus assembly pilin Flp